LSSSWKPLSDLPAVKAAIASLTTKNDDPVAEFDASDMVYNGGENEQTQTQEDHYEEGHYVADDGTRFVTDTQGEWVEFKGTEEEWSSIESQENKPTEATPKQSVSSNLKKKKKKSKKNKWSDKAQTDHNWV
jgi:hypothetical protein